MIAITLRSFVQTKIGDHLAIAKKRSQIAIKRSAISHALEIYLTNLRRLHKLGQGAQVVHGGDLHLRVWGLSLVHKKFENGTGLLRIGEQVLNNV